MRRDGLSDAAKHATPDAVPSGSDNGTRIVLDRTGSMCNSKVFTSSPCKNTHEKAANEQLDFVPRGDGDGARDSDSSSLLVGRPRNAP